VKLSSLSFTATKVTAHCPTLGSLSTLGKEASHDVRYIQDKEMALYLLHNSYEGMLTQVRITGNENQL